MKRPYLNHLNGIFSSPFSFLHPNRLPMKNYTVRFCFATVFLPLALPFDSRLHKERSPYHSDVVRHQQIKRKLLFPVFYSAAIESLLNALPVISTVLTCCSATFVPLAFPRRRVSRLLGPRLDTLGRPKRIPLRLIFVCFSFVSAFEPFTGLREQLSRLKFPRCARSLRRRRYVSREREKRTEEMGRRQWRILILRLQPISLNWFY